MKNRSFKINLEAILLSMTRIAEYIDGMSFLEFKRDYKSGDARSETV